MYHRTRYDKKKKLETPALLFPTNIIQNGPVSFTHNPPPEIRPSDFRLSYELKWVYFVEDIFSPI